jgi:endonuclease/exonuclease/phosphatase family metal-dependent hydrolase
MNIHNEHKIDQVLNNDSLNNDSLSVLSYNIFFGKLATDNKTDILDRIDNVCIEIIELNADVICLQEVTADRYKIIISNLEKVYPYRYPNNITQSYDTTIMSKHKIVRKTKIKYSVTRMARSIRFVIIESPFTEHNFKKNIAIATSHLESEFGNKLSDMNGKLSQYSEAVDILDQICDSCNTEDLIFCADFNSHNKISDTMLYKEFKYKKNILNNIFTWKDAWIEKGMDEHTEYTFDSRFNPMMLEMHSDKKHKPYYVSRLDRIFHKSSLFVHEFKMNKSNQLLSDHYPIIALFKPYPSSDKKEYIDYNSYCINLKKRQIKIKNKYGNNLSSKLSRISLFKK